MKTNKKPAESYRSDIINEILTQTSPRELERTKQRMQLASKIKDVMDKKGWNNTRLAKELDKHASEITKWLSGTHNFTSDTLFDIQDALGVVLISLEEEQEIPTISTHFVVSSENTSRRKEPSKYDIWESLMSSKNISKVRQEFRVNYN